MGFVNLFLAWVQIPAKRRFLLSMGFHQTKNGDWVGDFNGERLRRREFRRWTLKELKRNYTGFMF